MSDAPALLSPLFVAMAYDVWTRGGVHRTYVIGLAILVAGFSRVFLEEWEPWLAVGRSVFTVLMS